MTVALTSLSFDAGYYLNTNPDVVSAYINNPPAGMTIEQFAQFHFNSYGWKEGRDPDGIFDTSYYLLNNPDVANAHINPFAHYLAYGAAEGRPPNGTFVSAANFDSATYLAANPDVAAAIAGGNMTSAYQHYVVYGEFENRPGVQTTTGVPLGFGGVSVGSQNPGGNPGGTFTLTPGQDTIVGTAYDDIINAPPGAIGTLQSFDSIDGGAGVDTLNATLADGAIAIPAAPALDNVENVNLRVTNGGSAIDLGASTGVTNVTVANSTALTGVIDNVGTAALAVKNQNFAVTFDHSTATSLNLTVDTVGVVSASAPQAVAIDLGATEASKATTLTLTVNNSNVIIKDTAGSSVATTVNIAATGQNTIVLADGAATATTVSVTGAGFVDLSSAALAAVTTFTAGDGGVHASITNGTAGAVTVTTGAGNDTIEANGAGIGSIALGAGDDTVHVQGAFAAGAVLAGGNGTDTLVMSYADYTTVSAYGAPDLAKVTGFEALTVADVLAAGSAIDVSKIAGMGSVTLAGGVASGQNAAVTGLAAGGTVTLGGDLANNGSLTVSLKTDTASDTLNLVLNRTYHENNNAQTDFAFTTYNVIANGIETVNVSSSAHPDTAFAAAAGTRADAVVNTLVLTDDAVVTLNVSGKQSFAFNAQATQSVLALIDASANTAGASIDALPVIGASGMTIKGSATGGNFLSGTNRADTIVGGAGNDGFYGHMGGDTLTGNGGHDLFSFVAGETTIAAGNTDTIVDFVANTLGNGPGGAADQTGAIAGGWLAPTTLNGDIIVLTHGTAANNGVTLAVSANASDASNFLQQQSATETAAAGGANTLQTVHAALDASTGDLYMDVDGDGAVDAFIHLTGVTTLTTAAFVIN